MGLETGTYISDLNPANPLGTDDRSQGDDHIRLVKQVLKNTFPNVTGAVTANQTQLNKVAQDGTLCFPGMIVMWSGTVATIPAGWKLCNGVGTISTGLSVPDLRSRFIVGSGTDSGGTYNIRDTGGNANISVTGTTNGHAITINQMPSHTHGPDNAGTHFVIRKTPNGTNAMPLGNDFSTSFLTTATGGGQAHSHGLNVTLTNANIPPYYALAFIIKN